MYFYRLSLKNRIHKKYILPKKKPKYLIQCNGSNQCNGSWNFITENYHYKSIRLGHHTNHDNMWSGTDNLQNVGQLIHLYP